MVTFSAEEFYVHWVRVGHGPALLAVGVGGSCLDIFSLLYHFRSLHLSPGNGSIKTEILPLRTVKPKTTNQHSTVCVSVYLGARICIVLFNLFMRWARASSGEPALSGDRFCSYNFPKT